MPRLEAGERAKKWSIKTKPDLLTPKLEAIHEEASQKISVAYTTIDKIYEKVARILDSYSVSHNDRIIYRSYAEELYKCTTKLSRKALTKTATAITLKYISYSCDIRILREIASLCGVTIDLPNSHILTFGLGYF